ncbi:MAG: aminotransferase class I/II-fold pyridoxal phosphate-dependent enzyme [Bacteroidota bacterium]
MDNRSSAAGIDLPDDIDLRSILLQSRRLGVRERTQLYSTWIRRVQARGESMYHRVITSPVDRAVTVYDDFHGEEREVLMFGSNTYLGLQSHPYIQERMKAAIDEWGAGIGGAPLLSGYSALHRDLEERLADFKGTEEAVIYQSGYGANVGLLTALLGKKDVVYYDGLSHASTLDGLNQATARAVKFAHNDMEALAGLLEAPVDGERFVCVEGVYSMDGDLAPLDEVVALSKKHGAFVIVDDAHGVGVVGHHGRGTANHFGVTDDVDAHIGTFSKVFGVTGGAVCTDRAVADFLRHFSRSNVFSSSLPPAIVAAVHAGLDLLERDDELIVRLHDNVAYFARQLRRLGFDVRPDAAIVPLPVPKEMNLRRAVRFIYDQGVFANAVEYPAVAVHRQRIRFSLMASHTRADIDRVVEVVEQAWERFAGGVPASVAAPATVTELKPSPRRSARPASMPEAA